MSALERIQRWPKEASLSAELAQIKAKLTGEAELRELISDEEVERVHGNANFGPNVTKRQIIAETVLKHACGYSTGHTAMCIAREHSLLTWAGPGKKPKLTAKGKKYLWAAFSGGNDA